jgi:Plasmid pRiA4b ORF-3-like protein
MRIRSTGAPLYRIKVTLRGSRPAIWRRFVVPSDITLKRCHDALQAVMGWTDSHLHQFEAWGNLYGTSDPEFGVKRISEARTTLDQVLKRPKDRMRYEYDFGDSWEHDVVLEAVLPSELGGVYPQVEAGKRACPPEDVGGVHGYVGFLEALRDSSHPEHAEVREWVGREFDPEAFTVREANLAIHGGWTLVKNDA